MLQFNGPFFSTPPMVSWYRDDDGDCMSSEGSQRGSSMEDSGSVSNDYPSGRATRPTMYGDMHGQPRTLTFAKQVSTSHCMEPAISHASLRAPFSRAPLPGSFEQRSWSTETYAPPSKTENGKHPTALSWQQAHWLFF